MESDELDPEIWVSQSEAARRLSEAGDVVTQQQLSRYLETWPELERVDQGRRKAMLVNFPALQKHRRENIRVQEAKAPTPGADDDASAQLRLRERSAAAELREFELARVKGEVISRADALRAIRLAAVSLRQAHQRTRFERAERLDGARDVRAKVGVLTEQDEAVERAFSEALSKLASDTETAGDDDSEDDDDARSVIEGLTA